MGLTHWRQDPFAVTVAYTRILTRTGAFLYLIVAAAFSLASAYAASVASWTTIVKDQWRIYDDYLSLPFPNAILVGQNGHHPVVTGLLALGDIRWFGGHNYLLNSVGMVLAVICASTWSWMILKDREIVRPMRWLCVGVVWLLLFWLANSRVLVHGNESTHVFPVYCGLFLALIAVQRCRTRQALDHDYRGLPVALMAAFGCLVATFSFGLGLLTWPIVLGLAIVVGVPRGVKWILAIGAAGAILVYFALPSEGGAVRDGLQFSASEIVVDAATWLGAPVFHALKPWGALSDNFLVGLLAPLAGAVGVAVGVATLVAGLRHNRHSSDLEIWNLAIVSLGIGSAVLIAAARSSHFDLFPNQRVAPRYLVWACAFWAATLTTLALHASRVRRGRGVATGLLAIAMVALPLGIYRSHTARVFEFAKYQHRDAALGLALGVNSDELTSTLFARPEVVRRVAPKLKRARLGPFSGSLDGQIGAMLSDFYRVTTNDDLTAVVTRLQSIPGERRTIFRVAGRIEGDPKGYSHVALVDQSEIISGWGLINGTGHRLARGMGLLINRPPRFAGYVTRVSRQENMTLYAVALERGVATLIGHLPAARMLGTRQDPASMHLAERPLGPGLVTAQYPHHSLFCRNLPGRCTPVEGAEKSVGTKTRICRTSSGCRILGGRDLPYSGKGASGGPACRQDVLRELGPVGGPGARQVIGAEAGVPRASKL